MVSNETTIGRAPRGRRKAENDDEEARRTSSRSKRAPLQQQPLSGVIVFVDARLDNGCSMDKEYGEALRSLGAIVRKTFPKKIETLTHLVWSGGSEVTAQRAVDAGVKLVDASWVFACQQEAACVDEAQHSPKGFVYVPGFLPITNKQNNSRQKKNRPPPEPVRNQWKDLDDDNFDLCFSSSQRDPDLPDRGGNQKLGQHQSVSSKTLGGNGFSSSPPPDSGPLSCGKSCSSEATTVPDGVAASSSVEAQEEEVVDDDDGDYVHGDEDGGGEFTDEAFAMCDETEIENSPIVARSSNRRRRISGNGGTTVRVTGSGDGNEEKEENSGKVLGKKGKMGAGLQRGLYRLNQRSILSPSAYLSSSFKGRQRRGAGGAMETTPEGGYQRVFDVSEGGGDETENTVLDSTDCDSKISPQAGFGVRARTSGQTSQTEIDSSDGSSDSDLDRGDETNQRGERAGRGGESFSRLLTDEERFPVPTPGSSSAVTSATEETSKTITRRFRQKDADEFIEKTLPVGCPGVVGVSGKSYRESARAWLEANSRSNGGSSSGVEHDEKTKKGRASSLKPLAKRTYGSPAFSPGGRIVASAPSSATNTTPLTNGGRKAGGNGRARASAGSEGSDRTSTPASGYAADCSPGGGGSAGVAAIEGTRKPTKGRARIRAPVSGDVGGGDSRSRGVGGGKGEVENSGIGEGGDGGWTCDKCTYDNEPKRRRCFMCSSCPPAGAQLRVRSVTDGGGIAPSTSPPQKQQEQQQAEKSSTNVKADDSKRSNHDSDVAGAGGVGPKESGGRSRNKRVQTGRKGGVRATAMADASAAESSASGEWDRLGDGGGGGSSTESSSKRTRSRRLSSTPIHPAPLPKTGDVQGDSSEEKKQQQQQGQISSSPESSSHIRNVSAGAAPDSSRRAGSRLAKNAIEVGPLSGESSTFQEYERGAGGGKTRAKAVSQGEEAVGEAAVRLFAGAGSFPRLPGFSMPVVEDADRVSVREGLGQGANSRGCFREANNEGGDREVENTRLSGCGTEHGGFDEALEGSMDGDLGRGAGLNGIEEPDTVSKRVESTEYDGSTDSNDGQASDDSKATGKRRKGRVERARGRVSPQASPGGGSLASIASGRAAGKTRRATGAAPDSVEEAHRAASLLVAMRPSAPKAVEVEAEASRGFPTGGVGTKGKKRGGGKGRWRKVSAPEVSSQSGASAKGKASGGGEMSSGGSIGNSECGKDGDKKRHKTSDVADSNTPDIDGSTGGLMTKAGGDKKGKKKQEKKVPVKVSTSKGGGTGFSTGSGVGSKLTVVSNGTKVTSKRKGKECKEGIGGKRKGVREGGRDGKGPGDGTRKEISQEKRPKELEGVVRVAFSGLSPADRQAAASVVRSLSRKRKKPPGSGMCNSDGEAFTHLVIPDESRRTLKVLFALCAPLGPNGMPPVVVTVAWLYASLEAGYFVDYEAFRPARYRGPQSEANASTVGDNSVDSHSISSRLLCGERVMVGGVADPPPDIVENLARAAGAEVTACLREATLLLVGSKHELQEWVDGEKAAAVLEGRASKKIRTGGRRNLAPSTASARNASLSNRGDIRACVPGFLADGGKGKNKKRSLSETDGATSGGFGWGKEEDDALSALKSAGSVVCLQWFFDSVERGVVVDREEFIIQGGGDVEEVADLGDVGSQEW